MKLSSKQKAIIIGTVLGDGSLEFLTSKKGVRLQVLHSNRQFEYVKWEYEMLKKIVRSEPKQISKYDERYKKTYFSSRFRTVSHPYFLELRRIFHPKNKKIIPKTIDNMLVDPISLAVWYMDDGKRRPDCRGIYLDTICFSKTDQDRLIKCLEKNFGIKGCRLHWNGEGYHIYIPYPMSIRFREIVEPYVPPSMLYKLPPITPERLSRRKRLDKIKV